MLAVKRLKRCGRVLAAWFYNRQGLVCVLFFDGKNYLRYDGEYGWSRKNLRDAIGWFKDVKYDKGSAEAIKRFLKDGVSNAAEIAIDNWIYRHNEALRCRTKINRQQRIDAKINSAPKIPKRLDSWCEKHILPESYIFISKPGRGGARQAHCGACGHMFEVRGVKHRTQSVCPHCKRRGMYWLHTYRPPVDKFKIMLVQKSREYVIYRWMKAERTFQNGACVYGYEDFFYIFDPEHGRKECYKYRDEVQAWRESGFWSSYVKTWAYLPSVRHVLAGAFPDVDIGLFEQMKRPVYFYALLTKLKTEPITEYLVKAGLFSLASCNGGLNKNGRSFASVLGVNGQYAPIFREMDIDSTELCFIKACGVFLNADYLLKLRRILKTVYVNDLLQFANRCGLTVKKMLTYICNQCERLKLSADTVKTLYEDYIGMCRAA